MDTLTLTVRFIKGEPLRKGATIPDNAGIVAAEVYTWLSELYPYARIRVEAAGATGNGVMMDTIGAHTVNITALETAVLDCIARNLYQPSNGGVPDSFAETSPVWTWGILTHTMSTYSGVVTPRSLPGVVSSLVKKGLVTTQDDGNDSTIALTEAGFTAWESLQATGKV